MRSLPLIVLLLAAVSGAKVIPGRGEDLLVSTKWLSQHLADSNLVLVEIGPDENDYKNGHIPNARFLPVEKIANEQHGLKHELLPMDELVANLEALGISNDSRVVIYASQYPTVATRLYWTLDYLGIANKASLLDGGIDRWKSENRPLMNESSVAPQPGKIQPRLNSDVLASLTDVQGASRGNGTVLIDSRPPKRYEEGHVPGAISLYWQQMVPKDTINGFLSAKDIRNVYRNAGIRRNARIITYCETGFQATHEYFTLKLLGYRPSMYDGSFNEWNDVKQLPTVTGTKPK